METRTIQVARKAVVAYFEYRTAIAEQLQRIPNAAEASQVAHAIAVQLAAHEAFAPDG